ncbi:viral A-type inclusion protein [Reticulomyxa filosa]|uniref:Viral A-type inclusion protein n=1 Tax=Reticulomyxa filosa TaxID=46433 RepID=X6M378_RETFI|nr:viral A-type inclusion protein [Reticulomyxa filosa]|eukprot:ETO08374.1 viral A-type inclusion protein [Reticulomyxa filosa]
MAQPEFGYVYGTLSETHKFLDNLSQEESQKVRQVFTIPQPRSATDSLSGNYYDDYNDDRNSGEEKDNAQQLYCLEKKRHAIVSKPVFYMSAILANGQTQVRRYRAKIEEMEEEKKRNDAAIANAEQSIETCKSEQKKVVEGRKQIEETENQLELKEQKKAELERVLNRDIDRQVIEDLKNESRQVLAKMDEIQAQLTTVDDNIKTLQRRRRENDTKQEQIRSFCSERQKALAKMKENRDNHIMQIQELEHHLKVAHEKQSKLQSKKLQCEQLKQASQAKLEEARQKCIGILFLFFKQLLKY